MSVVSGETKLEGRLGLHVTRVAPAARRPRLCVWWWKVKQFFAHRWRELPLWLALLLRGLVPGLTVMHGCVRLRVVRSDGEVIDYGIVGRHLVVTAGKNFVASAFDNTVEPEVLKYHAFGTGTTAAAAGDTALQTELTTQYATDNTRPTGTQAHATNTYTTVGTTIPDASCAITEWGLFNQASNAGGTLLDRQVFSAINLNGSGDSLAVTYTLTLS